MDNPKVFNNFAMVIAISVVFAIENGIVIVIVIVQKYEDRSFRRICR